MPEKSSDKISISKQKLVIIGLLIVILNPLPAGLIYGLALLKDPKTKKDAKLMIIFSLFWGAISLSLAQQYLNY
jgi:hypothetical protein